MSASEDPPPADELQATLHELARVRQENEGLAAELRRKQDQIEQLSSELTKLRGKHDKLVRQVFGRSTEKVDPSQRTLGFEGDEGPEAPATDDDSAGANDTDGGDGKTRSPRGRRRKGHRPKIPSNLPRDRREYHPSAEELHCHGCGGTKRPMGEETTEQLEYQPAHFRVIEHARVKYSCPCCEEGVVCPPLPPLPVEKGNPGPGLLAEVVVNKYSDHLPLQRQEKIFARHGVRISKSTLCDWVARVATLLLPIVKAIERDVLSRPVVQTDETGVLVLDEEQPEGRRKGRIWVYTGEPGEVRFVYSPTKETVHPQRFLEGYEGYLQADAYTGFDRLFEDGTVIEVACWVHCRRYFVDARDTAPEAASWAIATIRELFAIEREAKKRGLSADERLALRRERSAPVVDRFFERLEELQPTLLPRSPIADAVRYARNQEQALRRFLEDGRLELDNNRSERSLRMVALGRNNWQFAGSANGAHRAAILYTLILSCRELGIDPFEYLRDVVDRVSTHPARLIHELTPRGWKAAREREALPAES